LEENWGVQTPDQTIKELLDAKCVGNTECGEGL